MLLYGNGATSECALVVTDEIQININLLHYESKSRSEVTNIFISVEQDDDKAHVVIKIKASSDSPPTLRGSVYIIKHRAVLVHGG